MDPLTNQAATWGAERFAQTATSGGASLPEVDPAAQLQFEHALANPSADVVPAGPAGVDAAATSDAKPSLGDAILNGIEKLKTHHDVRAERIEQTLIDSGGELTMEEMMKLQFEVMQLGIEQDITTKMADKTSTGVQTLFRNQG